MSMIQDKNFPQTYANDYFEVGDGHKIYVEQLGDPMGLPIIFLHGGPGSGCQHNHKLLFKNKSIRLILFDQRGAGKSKPRRSLAFNTTRHLIADMEFIRKKLNIDKWLIVGGSWGSTLGLAYSQSYPRRVKGIVIRSIFLGTESEVKWAFTTAAKKFRPDLWENWVNLLPEGERHDPLNAYGKRLEHSNPSVYMPAAQAWSDYESALSELEAEQKFISSLDNFKYDKKNSGPNTPYFEWHYIKNNFFLKSNELLENAQNLNGIPGYIIQGRYDLLCPPIMASLLSTKWNSGEMKIVEEAAHSANSGPMRSALEESIDLMINKFV